MNKSYTDSIHRWALMRRDESIISLYRMLFSLNTVKFLRDDYDLMNPLTVAAFTDKELCIANEINDTLEELLKCNNDWEALEAIKRFTSVLYVRCNNCHGIADSINSLRYNHNNVCRREQASDMYSAFCLKYNDDVRYHVIAMLFLAYMLKDEAPVWFNRSDYDAEAMQSTYIAGNKIMEAVRYSVGNLHELCNI